VSYTFEFWEGCDKYSAGAEKVTETKTTSAASASTSASASTAAGESAAKYHTVTKGETLWGIANKYGMSLTELIGKNPQIKNPNLITVGQIIYI
jgi:LysM repeat protein